MIKAYKDVIDFHRKFSLAGGGLNTIDRDKFKKRIEFLFEEMSELADAHDVLYQVDEKDINKEVLEQYFVDSIDALLDIIYVALGTLDIMGVSHTQSVEHWDAIQKANMAKVKKDPDDDSEDTAHKDIVKPEEWVSPDEEHRSILRKYWNITDDKT